MKKFITSLFALVCLALFSYSNATAGGIGVGVTVSALNVEASGSETDNGDTSDASDQTASVSNDVNIGSIYAEYAADNNFALGWEFTPGSADVSDKVQTRTDTETSVTGTNTTTSNSRKFSAQAEVDAYNTIYAEVPVGSFFYVRAGVSQVDVNTTEIASGNGGSYGNTTLDGMNYGFGVKGIRGERLRWKLAYEVTDFDQLSVTSTGNSTGSNTNTIKADLDVTALKLSLGLQF